MPRATERVLGLTQQGPWSRRRGATAPSAGRRMEVPTRRSGTMPAASSASSIPACAAPRLAPPEKTKATGPSESVFVVAAPRLRIAPPLVVDTTEDELEPT